MEQVYKYKVKLLPFQVDKWGVIIVYREEGKRLDEYSSESDKFREELVYQSSLADCNAYISLHKSGILELNN